jgi:hypothetical protein
MVEVQKRDREILRLCHEQRFLLMDHVVRYFFKSANKREAYRRIAELEQSGLVRREYVAGFGKLRIIRATPVGVGYSGSFDEIPRNPRIDLATIYHDSLVTSVRLRIAELWDGWWYPEALMKAEDDRQHIPDGVFHFPNRLRAAIELEHSQKERRRFHARLRHWREEPNLALALYVATSDQIYRFIQREILSSGVKGRIGVVHWDALRDGQPPVWTYTGEYHLFKRRVITLPEGAMPKEVH